jgi:hypothetical protein
MALCPIMPKAPKIFHPFSLLYLHSSVDESRIFNLLAKQTARKKIYHSVTKKIKQFKMIQMKKQEVQNFVTVPLYMYVAYLENYMLEVSKILQLRKRFKKTTCLCWRKEHIK